MSALSAVFYPTPSARPVKTVSSGKREETKAAEAGAAGETPVIRDVISISARGRRVLAREEAARGRNETLPEYRESPAAAALRHALRLRPSVPPERMPLEEARERVTPRLAPPEPPDLRPSVPPADES